MVKDRFCKCELLFISAIHPNIEKQGPSSDESDFISTKVKSFESYRRSKGKEKSGNRE